MAIAFKTSEQETSDSFGSDDVVGRFRSGYQTTSGRPVGLDNFRVTTGDPTVAEAIMELMGADDSGVSEWDTSTEETLQVFTQTSEVPIIVEPKGVRATLVLWSRSGKKIVETDGEYIIEDGELTDRLWDGRDKTLPELKNDARDGVGPAPSLQVYFRLASNPDLGKFKFFSGSWTAIDGFNVAEDRIAEIGGPANATLKLERVEFTNKQGENVSFVKPVIKVHGAA